MRTHWLAGIAGCLLSGIAVGAFATEPAQSLDIDLGDGVAMKLVRIPAATFQQGSPSDEPGRAADETQREVTLSKAFYLSVYPVTRGQFAQFVKATGYRTEAEKGTSGGFGWDGNSLVQRKEFNWRHPGFLQTDSHPATIITYADAEAFNAWLTKKSHWPCELPTEAQWEYACRGGSLTPFYLPDPADIAWFKANAGNGTHPVGKKSPNAFGLYDMSGNVFQWCRDWYGPYDAGPQTDPLQTHDNLAGKPRRVLRGGSWLREANDFRSAARYKNSPGSRNADNGFRVATVVDFVKPAEAAPPVVPAERPENSPPPRPRDATPDRLFPNEIPAPAAAPLQPVELPERDAGSSPLWYVLPIVGMAAVVFVIFRIVVRRSTDDNQFQYGLPQQPAPTPASAAGSTVQRIVNDGFWLSALSGLAGHSVRYRCLLDGSPHVGQTVIQTGPHGHFVYTGGTPANVQILGVDPPGVVAGVVSLTGGSPQPAPPPSSVQPQPASPPSPFRGYPSAY